MQVIALLTDFGLDDTYVGVMKGVIAGIAPGAQLIDVTHGVPPQDVRRAALLLDGAWPYFPEGSIFLVVVDPGVGTRRRPVVVRAAGRLFVGPDNGLFGLLPDAEVRHLTAPWGLATRSNTFHGRDLFAPAAARLAAGARFEDAGPIVPDPTPLTVPVPHQGVGEVVHVDRYGNAITNLPGVANGLLSVGGIQARVVGTYGDGAPGEPIALTGSTGRLELAIRNGSAAATLGVAPGTRVAWSAS